MPTTPEHVVTEDAWPQADAYGRGLLVSECLDRESEWSCQIARDGLGTRRRKYRRFAGMAPTRADARNAWSSCSDNQLPAGRTRFLFASGTHQGVVTSSLRKLRTARSDGGASVGATER